MSEHRLKEEHLQNYKGVLTSRNKKQWKFQNGVKSRG